MDVIIYTTKDGGVALGLVCTAAGQLLCDPETEGARVVAVTPEFESFRVGTVEDLPGGKADGRYDRTFFEAFTDGGAGNTVTVDMACARGIHMGRIRIARNAVLVALDVEQLKGNDVLAVKQTLRDLPATFDLSGAKTPAALKKLWPTELIAG